MSESTNQEAAILNAALELPAGERAAYLDKACAGDEALRWRVEELLQAHEGAGGFMEEPAAGARRPTVALTLPVAEKVGDRIGQYKLLQQIGEGGCGVVYMAEQEQPVKRRVALKILKLGMDTKQVIARFEAERQALAVMDHPNIAKVLDAGATDTGRPYFVMELVRGIKITDYCDQNNLTVRERLDLFIQVCRAIQHAHQKGIIHRDIKPSNILVTVNDGVPVPKVIDFGIAKASQGRLTDQTLFTAFEQFIGTPAYMSPEQAVMTSLDIDTRSDIYSLGVLLYELLTGRTPFDQQELLKIGFDEMRRTIREREPQRPSARLSTMAAESLTPMAKQRHTEAPKLIHLVRGDLDWIVMKALEKDRSRRYETANGLASDILRHLNCEPVVARPPSRLYEFEKTVRRHKFGFAATAAIIVVLAAGIVMTTWQAVRATHAKQAETLLRIQAEENECFDKVEMLVAQGNLKDAEVLIHTLSVKALQRRSDLAIHILRLIAEWHIRREQWQAAITNFATALNVDPTEHKTYHALAPLFAQVGDVENWRRVCLQASQQFDGITNPYVADRLAKDSAILPEHSASNRAAARWADTVVAKGCANPTIFSQGAFCCTVGLVDYRNGRYQSALEWERKSNSYGHAGGALIPIEACAISAMASYRLGNVEEARGELAQAEAATTKAATLQDDILYQTGDDMWADWIIAHRLMAEAAALINSNSTAVAEQAYRDALDAHTNFLKSDWTNYFSDGQYSTSSDDFTKLGHLQWRLAQAQLNEHQPGEAEHLFLQAVQVFETAAKVFPDEPFMRQELAFSHRQHGDVLEQLGRVAEAESEYRAAVALYAELKATVPASSFYRQEEAYTTWMLAEMLQRANLLDTAEAEFRQAIALHEQASAIFPNETVFTERLGTIKAHLEALLVAKKKFAEAEQPCRDALAACMKSGTIGSEQFAAMVRSLREVLTAENKTAEVEKMYQEVLAAQRSALGNDSFAVAATLIELAGFLKSQNRPEEAAQAYRESMDIILKSHWEEHRSELPNSLIPRLLEAGYKQQVTNICRMALNSTLTNSGWFNNASWFLATTENPSNRDPALAVELAERAVQINPQGDWNTVGVACYRAGDFKQALTDLKKSEQRARAGNTEDNSYDTFFLAMAEHQAGNADAARGYYAHAIQWMDEHDPKNPELLRFRAEAQRLLGSEVNGGPENQFPAPPTAK